MIGRRIDDCMGLRLPEDFANPVQPGNIERFDSGGEYLVTAERFQQVGAQLAVGSNQ
jgi:hypothetical protein